MLVVILHFIVDEQEPEVTLVSEWRPDGDGPRRTRSTGASAGIGRPTDTGRSPGSVKVPKSGNTPRNSPSPGLQSRCREGEDFMGLARG
jgi:hypothetical protein